MRVIAFLGLLLALALVSGHVRAETRVPVQLQAELVAKIAAFDRSFPARARGTARLLVVQKSGDDDSARVAAHFAKSVESVRRIGGLEAQVETVVFKDAGSLAERCKTTRPALVYMSTGFDADIGAVARALAGVDVLTIGSSAALAERGAVVGFDLEEGRARIVVNTTSAKAQNVDFKAELLKLARVVGNR